MKRLIYIAILMAGCSKGDTSMPNNLDGYELSSSPITFETDGNWGNTSTRGFETTSTNFAEFGVLGYYTQQGETINDATPNFMYNQKVSLSNNVWSYSPTKYWSNNDNDRIQFFGYHPYNSANIELSANDATGYPTFTVTPNTNPYDQRDFLFASTDLLGKNTESVSFGFSHRLAQARIYIAHCGDNAANVNILNITISGYRASGVLIYDETQADNSFVWQHQQGTESVPDDEDKTIYYLDDAEIDTTLDIPYLATSSNDIGDYASIDLGLGESYLMLIPQSVIGTITFTVLFSYDKSGSKVQAFQELSIAPGSTLVENEIKSYLLLIDPTNVGFGSIRITSEAWSEVNVYYDDNESDGAYQLE